MSPRKAKRQKFVPKPEAERWARASGHLRCSFGCAITPGMDIRFGRYNSIMCGPCVKKHYKLDPPQRPFTFRQEAAEDVRDRQVGGE